MQKPIFKGLFALVEVVFILRVIFNLSHNLFVKGKGIAEFQNSVGMVFEFVFLGLFGAPFDFLCEGGDVPSKVFVGIFVVSVFSLLIQNEVVFQVEHLFQKGQYVDHPVLPGDPLLEFILEKASSQSLKLQRD